MLIDQLTSYLSTIQNPGEKLSCLRFLTFLSQTIHPFHRENLSGHITASACIISSDAQSMALLHHAKLEKWLQPGGHCDGNSNTFEVALKEAQEETGIQTFIAQDQIWDVDVHWIPARKKIPGHWHYDIRYLLQTHVGDELLVSNEESNAIQWVKGTELTSFTQESSILRMRGKLGEKYMSAN